MEPSGHSPIWSGQRVQRTNSRGRHSYVPAFKRWIVEQAMQPGMSVAGLAMSNQVNANQLRRWVQLHGPHRANANASEAATLLPVTVAMQEPRAPVVSRTAVVAIEVELGGALVRVHDGVSLATLRMVLACVRGTAP